MLLESGLRLLEQPVQRQEGKIKAIHFDIGNTDKFTYSGERKEIELLL